MPTKTRESADCGIDILCSPRGFNAEVDWKLEERVTLSRCDCIRRSTGGAAHALANTR